VLFDRFWEIEEARPDYVYISGYGEGKVLTLSSFSEDSPVLIADKTGGLVFQSPSLGAFAYTGAINDKRAIPWTISY